MSRLSTLSSELLLEMNFKAPKVKAFFTKKHAIRGHGDRKSGRRPNVDWGAVEDWLFYVRQMCLKTMKESKGRIDIELESAEVEADKNNPSSMSGAWMDGVELTLAVSGDGEDDESLKVWAEILRGQIMDGRFPKGSLPGWRGQGKFSRMGKGQWSKPGGPEDDWQQSQADTRKGRYSYETGVQLQRVSKPKLEGDKCVIVVNLRVETWEYFGG